LHKNGPKLIFIVDKTEIKSIKPLQVEQHAPLDVGAVTVMTRQKAVERRTRGVQQMDNTCSMQHQACKVMMHCLKELLAAAEVLEDDRIGGLQVLQCLCPALCCHWSSQWQQEGDVYAALQLCPTDKHCSLSQVCCSEIHVSWFVVRLFKLHLELHLVICNFYKM
jgi:hypothetical protein